MQQALHSSMVKHLLHLLACNLLNMLRGQTGWGWARTHSQRLQEIHQNFEIVRQPQQLSEEQSSGIQQKCFKYFTQKKATEYDKTDCMIVLLILAKFYQASSFFWEVNQTFEKCTNSLGSRECHVDFEIFPFYDFIKLLLIYLNIIMREE